MSQKCAVPSKPNHPRVFLVSLLRVSAVFRPSLNFDAGEISSLTFVFAYKCRLHLCAPYSSCLRFSFYVPLSSHWLVSTASPLHPLIQVMIIQLLAASQFLFTSHLIASCKLNTFHLSLLVPKFGFRIDPFSSLIPVPISHACFRSTRYLRPCRLGGLPHCACRAR
jgi:hypothetical protein